MNGNRAAFCVVGLVASVGLAAAGLAAGQDAAAPAPAALPGAGANRTTYLGDAGRTHYSTLTQISCCRA